MGVKAVTSLAEFQQIINEDKYTVFDFWAPWMGPCRVTSPLFEKLSGEYEHIDFYKVDVDTQPEISKEVDIKTLPAFKLFKKGEQINQFIGASRDRMVALLQQASV
ncbi:hypothetical protein HWV62_43924 [Athelia sp. TMB]|nr:hypothetical protein HWV62_37137 [Athelia sp. TMB]KAF7985965.1 hypothetical protein HWV62_43924 [Athelia sp. TMB]